MWLILLALITLSFSLEVEIRSNYPLRNNNFLSVIEGDDYEIILKALKRIPEFKEISYKRVGQNLIIYIERYPIIKKIKIKGNLYLRDYEIKNVLGLEENSPLFETNPKTLENILTEYYRELGFLNSRVKVSLNVDSYGYAYIDISIKEGDLYFLGDVLFRGRESISKDELLKVSGLIIGEVFNRDKALEAEDRLEDYYRKKGYLQSFVFFKDTERRKFKASFKYALFPKTDSFFEKVSIGVKNLFSHPVATLKALVGKGKVGIPVYEIYEGERIVIKIRGNKHISEKELLSLFDYNAVGLDFFSLEKYKEQIVQFYKSKGFFDVSVDYELRDGEVLIKIHEGRRYKAKVFLNGETFELPYDKERIEGILRERLESLKELGYLHPVYTYKEEISKEKKVVYVFIKIDKGFKYILGSVKIKDKLFEELNRNLEALLPTILREDILDKLFTAINNKLKEKGYFDAEVNVNIEPVRVKDILILHYEITVNRGPRYTYGRNILYGYEKTREREINYMLVKEKYFDKKIEEESVWNLIESDIFESVQLDDIIDRKNKKVHRVINVKEKKRGLFEAFVGYSTYENIKFGVGVILRNLLGIGLINRNSYTKSDIYELYEVKFKDNFFFTRRLFTELILFSRYDDRDFYELFTRGASYTLGYRLGRFTSLAFSLSRFRAKTEGAENGTLYVTKLSAFFRTRHLTLRGGKSVAGRDYYTFELNAKYGRDVVKDLFGFRIKGGYGYASSGAPIFERFFLGGFQYMKGYSYQSIGAPDGKRQYLYVSPEVYRVFKGTLEFITFAEAGNAKNKFSRIIKNLKYDVGLGVGIRTPAGLIRGEVAYPLDEYKFSLGKIKFYLSVDLEF
ncbi:BamA/OMP85 family outer membrane protein [Aquifex sp.]